MARMLFPKKTWRYTNDFKARAVKLSHTEGVQVKQVAEGLGIHPLMLSRWRKEFREGKFKESSLRRGSMIKKKPVLRSEELVENARLRKENERLKLENELLKKWQRYLAEEHQKGLDSSKDLEKN